jgi:hypothetical protein
MISKTNYGQVNDTTVAINELRHIVTYKYRKRVVSLKIIKRWIEIVYGSVSQTMVRGPQVVLEVFPCGPSKKTEEEIKFKWIAYHTIAENLRVWKLHMAIVFHFFSQHWHFMKFITLPAYRLPTLLSATKVGSTYLCDNGFSSLTKKQSTEIDSMYVTISDLSLPAYIQI